MTRWKASFIHLCLSALVIAAFACLIVWRWYPPGLFHMAQADKLLGLLGGVDVVLGPLLTLIVYKQGKKSLRFDLSCIALMQVAALGFGLHTAWASRPVYLVAAADRFTLVFANEIAPADLAAAPKQYRRLPAFGAEAVGIIVPTDPKLREQALMQALAGKDLPLIPAHYRPYSEVAGSIVDEAESARHLAARLSPSGKGALLKAITSAGRAIDDVRVVPIESTRGNAAMLLQGDGTVIGPMAMEVH